MPSKSYRLREFISPITNRSLILDASAGLSLGVLPGLSDFVGGVKAILPLVDGLVTSPGMARRVGMRTQQDAALLVRSDWTNALRDKDFVLPLETVAQIPLLLPEDALDLGASALVVYFLLGHDEQVEADCLKISVQLAISGSQVGMPLIVDVQPLGPRVRKMDKAIELGVSYALEAGADGVAVPWPGIDSFRTVVKMAVEVPIWIKLPFDGNSSETQGAIPIPEIFDNGGAGIWLDETLFARTDSMAFLTVLSTQVHDVIADAAGSDQ